jgi:hypothetical protein
MYDPNVALILSGLRDSDRVLDIGGWASPLNRANVVLDLNPYETRGAYRSFGGKPNQGGGEERFTKASWVQWDLCAREPYPFKDKEFEYVTCSHVLEDLRDPLWVCSEMIRIGKRGYIETPSRMAESCRGWERREIAGLSHHRWLVEMDARSITFRMKPHVLHTKRYSFAPSVFQSLRERERLAFLFWNGDFGYREHFEMSVEDEHKELARFVETYRPLGRGKLVAMDMADKAVRLGERVMGKLQRLRGDGWRIRE